MSYNLLETSELKGITSNFVNNIYNPILLNRTLYVYDKNQTGTPYSIGLYDSNVGSDIKIRSVANTLYYNDDKVITADYLVSEINEAYTVPGDSGTYLTVSNISVLGDGVNNGYVNMSTIQGASGVGWRFNHTNNKLEVKDGTSVLDWISLPDLVNSTNYLVDLQDVTINSPAQGQVLVYNQPSNIWVNATFALPITLNMQQYSTTIFDKDNYGVLELFSTGNTSTTFIQIKSGDGTGPTITANSSPTITNIPITIEAIGNGDISLIAPIVYTSGNLDVNATTLTQTLTLKSTSNTVSLIAPTGLSQDYTLTLPLDDGTSNGQVLATDGSGILSWQNMVSAAGTDMQIQYNSGGGFAATSSLTVPDSSNIALNAGSCLFIGSNNSILVGGANGITMQTDVTTSITLSSAIIMTPQDDIEITDASIPGTFTIERSVILFNLTDNTNVALTTTYTITASYPSTGQLLHIFFDNVGTNKLRIDFGAAGLVSGSGIAQYLTFLTTGQSASLIWLNGKWRITNTGALVS
jgi:hypothetical protein